MADRKKCSSKRPRSSGATEPFESGRHPRATGRGFARRAGAPGSNCCPTTMTTTTRAAAQLPLPVLRVKLGDPLQSWVYIDPGTSGLVASVRTSTVASNAGCTTDCTSLDSASGIRSGRYGIWDDHPAAGRVCDQQAGVVLRIRRLRELSRVLFTGAIAGVSGAAGPSQPPPRATIQGEGGSQATDPGREHRVLGGEQRALGIEAFCSLRSLRGAPAAPVHKCAARLGEGVRVWLSPRSAGPALPRPPARHRLP